MLKRLLKRLARPASSRLLARVDARVALVREELHAVTAQIEPLRRDNAAFREHFAPLLARVQGQEQTARANFEAIAELQTELQAQVAALNDYVPVILNAISTQNAAAREAKRTELELRSDMALLNQHLEKLGSESTHQNQRVYEMAERIADVERRGEFIRKEALFELRYGGQTRGLAAEFRRAVAPRVVAPEKLAAAGDDIRLNLGCGHLPLEGYVNVDGRDLDGVDVVADVGDLPFEPGTVASVHSAHLLEHFPVEELRRTLLPYWYTMLRPGGTFSAVVPDAETMINEYAAGRYSFDDLRLVTFGDQEYEGDFHFNMFSQESIREILEEAGFVGVTVLESGRRNGACYEMEVEARRPGADG